MSPILWHYTLLCHYQTRSQKLQLGGSFVQNCEPFRQNTGPLSKIMELLNKIVGFFNNFVVFFKQNSGFFGKIMNL